MNLKNFVTISFAFAFFIFINIYLFGLVNNNFSLIYFIFILLFFSGIIYSIKDMFTKFDWIVVVSLLILLSFASSFFATNLNIFLNKNENIAQNEIQTLSSNNDYLLEVINYQITQADYYQNLSNSVQFANNLALQQTLKNKDKTISTLQDSLNLAQESLIEYEQALESLNNQEPVSQVYYDDDEEDDDD